MAHFLSLSHTLSVYLAPSPPLPPRRNSIEVNNTPDTQPISGRTSRRPALSHHFFPSCISFLSLRCATRPRTSTLRASLCCLLAVCFVVSLFCLFACLPFHLLSPLPCLSLLSFLLLSYVLSAHLSFLHLGLSTLLSICVAFLLCQPSKGLSVSPAQCLPARLSSLPDTRR